MRVLGLLFIIGGCILCATVVFLMPGLCCVGVGALLRISAGPAGPSPSWQKSLAALAIFVAVLMAVGSVVWYQVERDRHAAVPATVATQHTLKNCTTTEECEAILHRDAEQARKRNGWGQSKKKPSRVASPAQ